MEEVTDLRIDNRSGPSVMVEELMKKIPGYAGYLDREKRRDADRVHREYVAKRLVDKKRVIQEIGEGLLKSGGMKYLSDLDGLNNLIDRISQRIKTAVSGSGSFFSAVEVDTVLLDRIYEHDMAMLHDVEALDQGIDSLRQAAETKDNVVQSISRVRSALIALDGHVDTRDKILKGLE